MTARDLPPAMVATGLFIASEATFFVLLVLAYVFLHRSGAGPTAAASLDPARTAVFTAFLVASSGTFWAAERRLRAGDGRGFAALVALTIALGIVFLAGQGAEWSHLLRSGVAPRTNPFATSFFTLTGFHGLHVIVGLVLLAVAAGLGHGRGARGDALVRSAGWYWHFVDVVWIAIFSIVYLGAAA